VDRLLFLGVWGGEDKGEIKVEIFIHLMPSFVSFRTYELLFLQVFSLGIVFAS
jgi:hypothetical protein